MRAFGGQIGGPWLAAPVSMLPRIAGRRAPPSLPDTDDSGETGYIARHASTDAASARRGRYEEQSAHGPLRCGGRYAPHEAQ